MPDDPTDAPVESLLALELTGRSSGVSRDRLYAAMSEFAPDRIAAAVTSFEAVGLARSTPRKVYPSFALQRLDALGMIHV
jgi:hypothetical protein